MINCYQGEFSEFFYQYTIRYDRNYQMPFKTTSFQPLPDSNQKWQFEVASTDSSGEIITLDDFYENKDSEIRVTLFKHNGNIPTTIEWSGVITLDGISCAMESSSRKFYMKYEDLLKEQDFVFKKDFGTFGVNNTDIYLECKMVVWGLEPPNLLKLKQCFKPLSNNRSILKVFKHMYSDAIMTDVVFIIGCTELKAHKCVLCAHSDVFRKMFEADMLEKSSSRISIVDCDSQTFSQFLEFLYTGELNDELPSCPMSLFAVADKYNVEDLRRMCVKQMCSSISEDNVITILVCAHLYSDEKMKESAKTFIRKNFVSVACQRGWAEMVITYPDLAAEIKCKWPPLRFK